jgi:hypothetical protein
MEVETQLFNNAQFVDSIQASLFLFQREFPLVYARVKQLRGDLEGAINDLIALRFADKAPLVTDKKKTIPAEVQAGMNVFATYYLALAHLEGGHLDWAKFMFLQLLEMVPEFGPNQPYYSMFRWGANANLARIYEAEKDARTAIAYYTQRDPTSQHVGNQLRARDLVWRNPMDDRPEALPAAPLVQATMPGSFTTPPAQPIRKGQ